MLVTIGTVCDPVAMTRDPTAVLADPRWLAHRYDPIADAVHFIAVDRQTRGGAPFLTDEYLGQRPATVVPRSAAVAAADKSVAPINYIFHSAYCCSTLLADILDRPRLASTLKEPVILNDLVGWRHRGGAPDAVGRALDSALALLARPFDRANEQVVVKPSNVVNGLALAMLGLRPHSRALLLHAPLRVYLTSIARKGMWGRVWVRDLLAKQLTDNMIAMGFEPQDYLRLTDLQVAAVGWLAQADLFAQLCARFPNRVRTLDSEVMLARPAEALAALAGLYGWSVGGDVLAQMSQSEAFTRNAKDGKSFAPGQRAREQAAVAALHADEIDKVAIWAEAVADNAGIALALPGALLR